MTTFPEVREALAAEHSELPWQIIRDGYTELEMHDATGKSSLMGNADYYPWVPELEWDWELICRAVNAAPAMLAHIDAQAAEIERLKWHIRQLLKTRDAEAKAWFSLENAMNNMSSTKRESRAHLLAMTASSNAEREARAALEQTK
jgi:hypothetical protein